MDFILIMTVLLVAVTVVVGIKSIKGGIEKTRFKTFVGMNIFTFFALMLGAAILIFGGSDVMAAEEVADVAVSNNEGLKYIAAALSTGLAAIGAGIAVAITGSAAIGAISEDSKLLGKTIIFVGLAEGIAIYGLIISIMILGR